MKKILFYLFGASVLGVINPAIWILFGCLSPLAGMLFENETFSKPVNPAAIFFWVGGLFSIAYNVYWGIKESKEAKKAKQKNKPTK